MPSFSWCELWLITVLVLLCDSYMSWSARFISLKLCVGFFIFDSVSFSLKFIYLFNKMHGLFDFKNAKILFTIKIIEKPYTVPRHLIFKLQQEFWKFNYVCVSWSFPKTELLTNFLNLENRSFEKVSFFQ